jgi:hypothetical protein
MFANRLIARLVPIRPGPLTARGNGRSARSAALRGLSIAGVGGQCLLEPGRDNTPDWPAASSALKSWQVTSQGWIASFAA